MRNPNINPTDLLAFAVIGGILWALLTQNSTQFEQVKSIAEVAFWLVMIRRELNS
ncbi:MAG: hypothetical protein ACPGWR_12190 [Ardenticatenaceae bacterium]